MSLRSKERSKRQLEALADISQQSLLLCCPTTVVLPSYPLWYISALHQVISSQTSSWSRILLQVLSPRSHRFWAFMCCLEQSPLILIQASEELCTIAQSTPRIMSLIRDLSCPHLERLQHDPISTDRLQLCVSRNSHSKECPRRPCRRTTP
jgi:hypothetical protein